MDLDSEIEEAPDLPLTEECHHYDDISEVPWDIQKYERTSAHQFFTSC